MIIAKRIALMMATSAIAATLSGCEALDFLNFKATDKELEESAEATQAQPSQVSVGAINTTVQQPAPFDLGAAQPMLPPSTMNTQSSAANAALIGSTMGASPSGFGGLTPGIPTTTTTTSTYSYGAQPNPYAPRIPGSAATAAPSLAYQQALSAGTVSASPVTASNLYGTTYQPTAQPNMAVNTANTVMRAPSVAPLTAGLPSSAVSTITSQSIAAPNQPGTLDPANLSKSTITAIQTALKSRGLYSDVVDGVWGSNSKAAMNAYLATRGESAVSLDTLFSLGVSL